MPNVTIHNSKISAIVSVVPKKELCLEDDVNLYGGNKKQLRRVIKSSGFYKRRVSNVFTTTADLCQKAAEYLFSEYSDNRKDIKAIIFISQTPDYLMPATACLLSYKLGLPHSVAAFDINQGCAGYVYGLWIGSSLLNRECNKILLLVGDTPSKYTDMFNNGSAPIFGDAGSATLLEYDEKAEPIYFNIGTDGSNFDAIIAQNGGFRNPPSKDKFYSNGEFCYLAKMDGMRVMEFTLNRIPSSIDDLIKYAKINKTDIDWFIFHQANKIILKNIAINSELDMSRVPMSTLSKYGNQSSASIPCVLCDCFNTALSNQVNRLLLSGFGIGLCWCSCILTLKNIFCSSVITLEEK